MNYKFVCNVVNNFSRIQQSKVFIAMVLGHVGPVVSMVP